MNDSQLPMVSVTVITYNSSKTVLETLDSIYNQTYPTLELIVSDDCSTDNTVQVCCDWIEAHKDRFVRTELLTVEKNTGISANLNRAESACRGEWVKGIAGDDLLLPDCVSDYMDYVEDNPDAIYVFGRMLLLTPLSKDYIPDDASGADYSFFSLSETEQLKRLIFEGNCVPAPSAFYNLRKALQLRVNGYDERIPLMEDWAKWIMLLNHGVKFHYLDKDVVVYRKGGGISNQEMSFGFFRSHVLFELYYRYPVLKESDEEKAVQKMTDCICGYSRMVVDGEVEKIRSSKAYRLGKFVLRPFSWLNNLLDR